MRADESKINMDVVNCVLFNFIHIQLNIQNLQIIFFFGQTFSCYEIRDDINTSAIEENLKYSHPTNVDPYSHPTNVDFYSHPTNVDSYNVRDS